MAVDSRARSESTTSVRPFAARSADRERLYLLIIGDELYATHPLPPRGTATIGRSPGCEIYVDHSSVSRQHASLDLDGVLSIRDLGSSNGTRVRGRRMSEGERAELSVGDIVEVGAVQLHVQARTAPLERHRVWSHDYFDARLIEECARAAACGTPFAVLHVRTGGEALPEVVEDALVAGLRPYDTIAAYAPGHYEILVAGASEPDGLSTQLQDRLLGAGVAAEVAFARYPEDGRDADSLIARAVHGAREAESTNVSPAAGMQVSAASPVLGGLVDRIAQGRISVLILGETGVGKEVMARRIHRLSPRANKPFLGLNCAALTATLLESELFGHERGAFTSAVAAKPGLFETADGGTVFLDEIGEMPPAIQVKLLRVLEDRTVLRVGGIKPRPIKVRFLAATNRDLEADVAAGRFRQDLYFRLNGVTLTIPPLRERVDEIRELAGMFIAEACRASARRTTGIAPAALALLEQYAWPGNIRELRNVLERAVLLCPDDVITRDQLPLEKLRGGTPRADAAPGSARDDADLDFGRAPREQERSRIIAALTASGGNQTEAARLLGVSRRTLISRLERHNLPRPRKDRGERGT